MADFEAEINLAFNGVADTFGVEFVLQHISDAKSLAFHRPRAPEVSFSLLLPMTSSWARARGTTRQGPPRLRSRTWPLGVPGLDAEQRKQVETDNEHLRLTLEVGELLRQQFTPWVLSFPEQFGSTLGEPSATIWDLSELVQWARRHNIWRMALNQ